MKHNFVFEIIETGEPIIVEEKKSCARIRNN